MNCRIAALSLLAIAGAAAPLMAQTNIKLMRTSVEDFSILCQNRYTSKANLEAGSLYYIGTNAVSIAYTGDAMYVGGYLNSSFDPFVLNPSLPMARTPAGLDSNFADAGGPAVNPNTGLPVTPGQILSEVRSADNTTVLGYWATAIVKIEYTRDANDAITARTYRAADTLRNAFNTRNLLGAPTGEDNFFETRHTAFFGVNQMDFDASVGLLATFSGFSSFYPGKVRWYNPNPNQLSPILRTPNFLNQAGAAANVSGGAAWDFGAAGTGFDYLPLTFNGDGSVLMPAGGGNDGPLAAALVNAGGTQIVGNFGPLGLDKERLNLDFFTSSPYTSGNLVFGPGQPSLTIPAHNNGATFYSGAATGRSIWRDIDIHPRTGTIAARASNDLVIAYRNPNGSANAALTSRIFGDPGAPGSDFFAFSEVQKVAIMHGLNGGDAVAWNDWGTEFDDTPNFSLNNIIKLNKLNGVVPPSALTYSVVDAANAPLVVTLTSPRVDVAWNEARSELVVLDFLGRRAHIFKVSTDDIVTPPSCLADVASDSLDTVRNPNNNVGAEDLDAFIAGFIDNNAAIADMASDSLDTTFNPNGSVGSEDLDAFIAAFINGC